MYREHTKTIKIGNQVIGGGHPVLIQSMTNTKTEDVAATVAQILTLKKQDVRSSAVLCRRWRLQEHWERSKSKFIFLW